jgi:copper(I)-binding protein
MTRWLVGLVLGVAALGAVFLMWKREADQKAEKPSASHEMPMDMSQPAAPPTSAPQGPAPEVPAAGAAPETAPSGPLASAEGIIVVDEAWARPAGANGTTAVYMLMTNTAQAADQIVQVSSPDAAETSIHETRVDSKNVATMRPAAPVDLEPGVPLVFEPRGLHVMLTGLKHALKEGSQLTLIFTFQHAGTLNLKVAVGEQVSDGDSVQP